ncbi:MAG TPA: hypothetical protein VN642_19135 [Dongiaceae bacterium]|nr:hypothetical protein [Dongiaceae bacterium]
MKAVFLVLAFLLSGCAVSVKESYRNPDFKQSFDKISVAWIPLDEHEYKKKYLASSGQVVVNDALAMKTARKQLWDLQSRTRKSLHDELAYYDTDIVGESLSNYVLRMTPERLVKITCLPASCHSDVIVKLTMTDRKSDTLVWSSAIKVTSFARTDLDGKEELVTPDTTLKLVQSIIGEWNKYQLLPARLASPRSRLPLETASIIDKLEQTDLSYGKLLAWIKENNKWGKDAAVVKEFEKNLESAIGGTTASWKIGWGLTRSGKAYKIGWTKKILNIAELTPEEAALNGFREKKSIFAIE